MLRGGKWKSVYKYILRLQNVTERVYYYILLPVSTWERKRLNRHIEIERLKDRNTKRTYVNSTKT